MILMDDYEAKIISGQRKITNAVILKLVWSAIIVFSIAAAYSDNSTNLIRVAREGSSLPPLLGIALLSALMSILWLLSPIFHTVHTLIYALSGIIYYFILCADIVVAGGIGELLAAVFFAPTCFFIGLIPFLMCASGRKTIRKAKKMKKAEEMEMAETK